MTYRIIIIGLLLLFCNGWVMATPSGADLLLACEHSLSKGFKGTKGQMCIWYVTPCDCSYGKETEAPPVCLPVSVATETLVKEVITGLQDQTELQAKDADVAAAMILSRTYPCPD